MRSWKSYGTPIGRLSENDVPIVTNVFMHEYSMRICGFRPEQYTELLVTEDEDGEYLGWLNADHNDGVIDESAIIMVTQKQLFGMNFPGRYQEHEARGQGEAVRVRIDIIGEVGN